MPEMNDIIARLLWVSATARLIDNRELAYGLDRMEEIVARASAEITRLRKENAAMRSVIEGGHVMSSTPHLIEFLAGRLVTHHDEIENTDYLIFARKRANELRAAVTQPKIQGDTP